MAIETVYLSLGSNLGDRRAKLCEALDRIGAVEGVELARVSSCYRTEPVGVQQHPAYLNAVAEIRVTCFPRELLALLQSIECDMGRTGKGKCLPRNIDIDILLFGNRVISESDLHIPHPGMLERRFVLEPLAEIAPGLVHPVFGGRMDEWADKLGVSQRVQPVYSSTFWKFINNHLRQKRL